MLFVEGPSDKRFVDSVLAPRLRALYPGGVKIVEYAAGCSSAKVCRLVLAAVAAGFEYFLLCDLDEASCFTAKRHGVCSTYPCVEPRNVLVAAPEIEAWYLAGLDQTRTAAIGVAKYHPGTDSVTKEEFNRLRPRRFRSRIDFMREILKRFDLDHAVYLGRNRSLTYCLAKLGLGAS